MNLPPPSTSYDEWLREHLRDPEEARAYLDVALAEYRADSDREAFLLAVRHVVEAQGGVGALAKRTGLSREHLYRALSERGNPRLDTVGRILDGLGFRLALARADARSRPARLEGPGE